MSEVLQDRVISNDLERISQNLGGLTDKLLGKKVLISGAAGFLGSWMAETALKSGSIVYAVDNLIASERKNIEHLENSPRFKFIEEDITRFQIPKGVNFILHMASIASPPLYQRYPVDTMDSGVLGTRQLLNYTKEHPVKGFLFTSTSEVYGNPPDQFIPTPEDYYGYVNSFGPRAMYDESKRAGEAYCFAYYADTQKNGDCPIPVRISRIFNTYGPRIDIQNPSLYGRALIKFVSQALNNEPITVYGDGQQTRSFCYVTDQVTGLFKLLLQEGLDCEAVNIGNEEETTVLDLARKIVTLSGSSSEVRLGSPPNYNLEDDPRRRNPDLTKARKLLGYSPKVNLEEGLIRVIEWMRSQQES
jgi:UDP-glucuronate decarboxylase